VENSAPSGCGGQACVPGLPSKGRVTEQGEETRKKWSGAQIQGDKKSINLNWVTHWVPCQRLAPL